MRHDEDEEGPAAQSPRGAEAPDAYIDRLVKGHPVVLFMKGTPATPGCGFSARASAAVASCGAPMHAVDVLVDPEVREAIKDYSNWPTLPQLYVGGQFVGGADIVAQMHQSGELQTAIAAAQSGG